MTLVTLPLAYPGAAAPGRGILSHDEKKRPGDF
jgi:hypothetical protein